LHVIADALTSALAIAALAIGKFYGVLWLDSAIGLVGAVVILHWSYSLCRETGWELLDGHCKTMDWDKAKELLESHGAQVVDLRVWRIAPKALACELTVTSENRLGPDHYRNLLLSEFDLKHIVVEERIR
jgi:Co/Zn/Cd efflux system component